MRLCLQFIISVEQKCRDQMYLWFLLPDLGWCDRCFQSARLQSPCEGNIYEYQAVMILWSRELVTAGCVLSVLRLGLLSGVCQVTRAGSRGWVWRVTVLVWCGVAGRMGWSDSGT